MSLKRTYDYWQDVFGLEFDRVELNHAESNLIIVPHQAVEGYHDYRDYHGAFALQRGSITALSVPPTVLDRIEVLVGQGRVSDLASLAEVFAPWSERIVGPALQAYMQPEHFRPILGYKSRALALDDLDLITDLQQACDPTAWSHSGISSEDNDLFGCFAGETLVSVAKLLPWNAKANNVGVITHPGFQGRSYGVAAVSAVVSRAFKADKLVLYQTLKSNFAAVKLAQRLGFETFGESLSIRFKSDIK